MALNQLENTADIVDHALDLVGEPTDGTSEFENQALSFVRQGYQAVQDGGSVFGMEVNEEWLWLHKSPPGNIMLQPDIETTAALTNGSQALTFASAPSPSIDTHVETWFMQPVSVDGTIYRIATHDAAQTAASLDSRYAGATGNSVGVRLFKLEYDLPSDMLRLYAPMRVHTDKMYEITLGAESALDRDWPLTEIEAGTPTRAAYADANTIRFNRYPPSDLVRVELPYLLDAPQLSNATSDSPLMPVAHYMFLVFYAAHFLALLKEDDSKAKTYAAASIAALRSMIQANRARQSSGQRAYGKIFPRRGAHRRERFPVRTQGGFLVGE